MSPAHPGKVENKAPKENIKRTLINLRFISISLFLERPSDPDPDQIHAEVARLQSRDRQDQDREVAPLRKPPNALVVDTTHLTFHQQVDRIAAHARAVADGSAPPAVDAQNQ